LVRAEIQSIQSFAGRFLNSGLSTAALRTNALLRKEEWEQLDSRVVEVARQRLAAVADLRAAGLTLNLGDLGVLISQYETLSDMEVAEVSMSGVARGRSARVEWTIQSVPIPIVHKDFQLNVRHLEASRRTGSGVDTTQAEVAARLVTEKLEDILFNGSTVQVNGNPIWGYRTFPNRNTGTAAGPWDAATGAADNIFNTVTAMMADARADRFFGPYTLYVSEQQYSEMFIKEGVDRFDVLLNRIREIPGIAAVKPTGALADGEAVLVQLTRDVVDLAVGQDITTVEWETQGGMVANFKVMAAMAPRIKADDAGRSGVVHYTGL
jgi:uncharacterized linocin/CFP29 family protein